MDNYILYTYSDILTTEKDFALFQVFDFLLWFFTVTHKAFIPAGAVHETDPGCSSSGKT